MIFFQKGLWQPKDLVLTVDTTENQSINWTVPELPVLTIEFVKVTVNNRGGVAKPALLKVEDKDRLNPGNKVICTKWCDLAIENVQFLILWEFRQSEPPEQRGSTMSDAGDADPSSDEDATDATEYTVPFKVLGVAYKNRQTHLKKAYECLEEEQEVVAKLQPEPDNEHDENAIAVHINIGSDWNKVGYIARELTRELHPLIENSNIKVNVARIRFRVNYLLVGYYITLNISKKGPWSKKVVKASKKAQ